MTLPILWNAEARDDLAEIIGFIAERSPVSARVMKSIIQAATLPTAEYPYLFREGRVPGTREIVAHPNYIVVYRVAEAWIEIVNVVHAREQYPPN
jgi:toxin ParE1/3/4